MFLPRLSAKCTAAWKHSVSGRPQLAANAGHVPFVPSTLVYEWNGSFVCSLLLRADPKDPTQPKTLSCAVLGSLRQKKNKK